MDIMTIEQLKSLMEKADEFSVSLYIPTHRLILQQPGDRIHLRNIAGSAREKLSAYKIDKRIIEAIMGHIHDFFARFTFDPGRGDGMALFCTPSFFRSYTLPHTFKEEAFFGKSFYIMPLIPLIDFTRQFFLLEFSQKSIILWKGTKYELIKIYEENTPDMFRDILHIEKTSSKLVIREWVKSKGVIHPGVYHGLDTKLNAKKRYTTDYCNWFLNYMRTALKMPVHGGTPIIFAGVETLYGYLKAANTDFTLSDYYIHGNAQDALQSDLHTKAWEIMNELLAAEQERTLQRISDELHRTDGRASGDLHTIVSYVMNDNIDTLVLAKDHKQWGTYDAATGGMNLFDEETHTGEELLNLIACRTLQCGGTVHAVNRSKIPASGVAAALFHYGIKQSV